MSKTLVVYDRFADIELEWGWNTPEDIERVRENVRQGTYLGVKVYEYDGESILPSIYETGELIVEFDDGGNITP